MVRSSKVALLVVSVIGVAGVAYAAQSGDNDALAIKDAKLSLTEAVAVAETHASGKAVRAELESSSKGPVYEVEVVSGPKVFDVTIDAVKGSVLSSTEDKADSGCDEKHDDDGKK